MIRTPLGRLATLSLALIVLVAACGDADPGAMVDGSPGPTAEATMGIETTIPMASGDLAVRLCVTVDTLDTRLAGLAAIELRLPNRVALEIELGRVQAAFSELRQADLGELEPQLEDPLKRLGYRLLELELAIEDFRTNPRPRRAAPHVEEDGAKVTDALAVFAILARC